MSAAPPAGRPARIGLLPEHLIDQIKAGEVIERPGSLIKELLENSIDAGSTEIELTLKNNGLDLISVKDNGHGILSSDLPLAFSRHATSKINRFEDLYRLHSFGFRGEALASMAAVSKLHCVSLSSWESEGSEIKIEGGITTVSGKRSKSTAGTEINVQELFYNTPVRLKFIQSQQSEKNYIKKIIWAFILAHPTVEFQIKFDEDEKEIWKAREDLTERMKDIFPKARDGIINTEKDYEDNHIEIHLVPGTFRGPTSFQYVFVNHRLILDKQLQRVISNALMSAFGTDDFHFVASLDLPPDNIDVNVHPNKTIIKLFESSKLIGLITGTIKELSLKNAHPRPVETPGIPSFDFMNSGSGPVLGPLHERQAYNLEGHFSPHRLPLEGLTSFFWVGPVLVKNFEGKWLAIHAARLLKNYFAVRMQTLSPSVPLLVAEPFKLHLDVKKIAEYARGGIEFERLSSDTLVLRSIPEWMSSFPLRPVMSALLKGELELMEIDPEEWSQSTWEELLSLFQLEKLKQDKIILDLKEIFGEKFR